MNSKNTKLYFAIAFWALLIEIIAMPLRGYVSFMLCGVVTFSLFFIFQYIVLKKYEKRLKAGYILIASLIGCSFTQVPTRIIWFTDTLISLPDFLFHLLGIVLGYLFYISGKVFRIIILVFSLSSCLFFYFEGYDIWLHKLNFNSVTGIVKADNKEYNPIFRTNRGDTLTLSDFKGKYLLFDCWCTSCGVCYREMPDMQQLYDEYKQNPEVEMYAVHFINFTKRANTPYEDYSTGYGILQGKFSFPCLSFDDSENTELESIVKVFPTVLIFDKQSKLVFRGDIKYAKRFMRKLVKETKNK